MNRRAFLTVLPGLAAMAACSKNEAIRLALNWKPEPQFGGFYAANYAEYGLENIEILPGGAGTPTAQMIGAGSAEFGIVSADELVVARARGNDVVALFTVFQDCPQGIMAHASRNLVTIEDVLMEGTLAIQSGLPYARLLERQFGFDHVQVVPSPGGDISAFLSDPLFAQQCFIMSEPVQARRAGADVAVFPVADIGYNPYTTVLATRGTMLSQNLETARAMVRAVRDGWQRYLDDPSATNDRMHDLNPTMDPATFAETAGEQKPFILTDDARTSGLGTMTAERWEKLIGQLYSLGDITEPLAASDCFRAL